MVRTGPAVGLLAAPAGALVLLALLSDTATLSLRGWTVGIVCLRRRLRPVGLRDGRARHRSPGCGETGSPCCARCSCAVSPGSSRTRSAAPVSRTATVTLAAAALALDGIDGLVARHTGTVSELGARFDMEVDAFLILLLSAYASLDLGAWVLAIGLMRYGYVVAGWLLSWLREPVRPRYWRKVVAATQAIVLTVVVGEVLPRAFVVVAVVVALALLAESFGRDVFWQWGQQFRGAAQSGSGTRKSTTVPTVPTEAVPAAHAHVPPRRAARAAMSAMPLPGFASPRPRPSSATRSHAPAVSPAMVRTTVCAPE